MIRQPSRKLVLFLLIGLLLFTACKKTNDPVSLRPASSEDEDRPSEEVTSSSSSPLFPKPDSGKEEDPGESLLGEKEGENFRREFLVCLDPGHSAHASAKGEPIGPGAKEMKRMASLGSSGIRSGVGEYEVNLDVALLLRDELESRGYRVLMTRESQDVLVGNVDRARMANEAGADAFLRLHCDGSDNPRAKGAMAVTISPDNPYHPENYRSSYRLGQALIRGYTRATGLVARKPWTTDTMTGLNWAEGPAVLFEMGFLSNPEEDLLLQDHEFREKMVQGLADGLDAYFGEGADALKEKEDKDE
ncbi:N-acetylmuramoyl-L-alanine amidase [Kallipyga massiliensis]|uniref:N-acetylmuramoyl-L-alanine amidase family protein n=1 Tax=Kallipyga massiliensis TaxID=1472764 RepID=UPI0026F1D9DD|nr:N-acetylmuramoyl-L-alanine amidase [Kallipyga massiliensis]